MSEQESDCDYRKTCHFYSMKNMTPANKRHKELYCIEWPKVRDLSGQGNRETGVYHPIADEEAASIICRCSSVDVEVFFFVFSCIKLLKNLEYGSLRKNL